MKIISLQAENIKKLVAVTINPDGSLVQITGKNAQGKTSVLDSIWMALKVSDVKQEKPVRDGQERGLIRLTLGDKDVELIVTRKFAVKDGETTTSIAVTSPDGAKFPSPQAMLDKLLSSLTFDPLEFSRMDAQSQVKAVKSLLPGVDFDGTTKSNKTDFDRRTDVNRELKVQEAKAKDMPTKAPVKVDVSELVAELGKLAEDNALIETKKANRVKAKENIERWKAENVDLATRIKENEEAMADIEEKMAKAGPLPEPKSAADLQAKINSASEVNKASEIYEAQLKAKAEATRLQAEADKLSKAIEDRNASLAKAISEAKFPVAGLTFTEDALLLNGVPFNQASDAEQLRTSLAIAMSLNP